MLNTNASAHKYKMLHELSHPVNANKYIYYTIKSIVRGYLAKTTTTLKQTAAAPRKTTCAMARTRVAGEQIN